MVARDSGFTVMRVSLTSPSKPTGLAEVISEGEKNLGWIVKEAHNTHNPCKKHTHYLEYTICLQLF